MQRLTFNTERHRRVLDITDDINAELKDAPAGSGLCSLFVLHTTACLTTACLDPGTDLDLLDAFVEMVPKLKYRHPHDPSHVGDHIISSAVGPSITVPYEDNELVLGTWQRLVLVEMDGPRDRSVILSFVPTHDHVR